MKKNCLSKIFSNVTPIEKVNKQIKSFTFNTFSMHGDFAEVGIYDKIVMIESLS